MARTSGTERGPAASKPPWEILRLRHCLSPGTDALREALRAVIRGLIEH
jgi:hypothetical protein